PEDILVYNELPNTSVLISNTSIETASAPPHLITLVTNSNGSLTIELPVASDYLATISDPRFHLSFPFQILPNETTRVSVACKRVTYPVTFQDYADRFATGFSGGAGETVALRISSSSSIANVHDVVTLETLRASGDALALHQVQAVVVSESP